MNVYSTIDDSRGTVRDAQRQGKTVGLVPTMGALHEGHMSLIRASKKQCDITVVTIFVNPTQFGPNEDFDAYPRPMENDLQACKNEGVDIVFTPSVETIYPADSQSAVRVTDVTERLCGTNRPGHFDGVTTVVAKLFNILPANKAYFGEKDYQQFVVIKKMVRDLNMPIEIVSCPILREPDGLAMSSRNVYLTDAHRTQALSLSRSLFAAQEQISYGEREVQTVTEAIRKEITSSGPVDIDYIELVDADSLTPLMNVDRKARICLAVHIGSCRLIDNVGVDV